DNACARLWTSGGGSSGKDLAGAWCPVAEGDFMAFVRPVAIVMATAGIGPVRSIKGVRHEPSRNRNLEGLADRGQRHAGYAKRRLLRSALFVQGTIPGRKRQVRHQSGGK